MPEAWLPVGALGLPQLMSQLRTTPNTAKRLKVLQVFMGRVWSEIYRVISLADRWNPERFCFKIYRWSGIGIGQTILPDWDILRTVIVPLPSILIVRFLELRVTCTNEVIKGTTEDVCKNDPVKLMILKIENCDSFKDLTEQLRDVRLSFIQRLHCFENTWKYLLSRIVCRDQETFPTTNCY